MNNKNTVTNQSTEAPDAMFSDVLRSMAQGRALGTISAQLREVVEAVKTTGKAGKLSLVIGVEPMNGEVTLVDLSMSVTLKLPKPPMPSGTFFTDDAGGLSRRDPNQTELEFRPQVVQTAPATTATQAAPKAAASS
jgi:hypothetical protein